ncbi:MAG: CoA transferase [Chloroflexi bacterium]|nr:CoA transferase [Chloroflexota bacterium]
MLNPLKGIRVLDLTRLMPGGLATLMLADLGAEVTKIESPDGGDYARWMPPLRDGQSDFFRATNRNKHSAIVNLKHPQGVEVLKRLAANADVLIESFRPGVLTRLGLDREGFRTINPRLIVCALSGYGQDGEYAMQSGHDLNYTALAGLIGEMGTPQPMAGQVADIGGAYSAVASICAALFARERTGEGAFIDCALFDAAIPFFSSTWVEATARHDPDQIDEIGLYGRLAGKLACYNIYRARDGEYVALAALEPKFWDNFCRTVERPDLIPGYEKMARQPYLIAELQGIFAVQTADEWEAILGRADCCFSRVNTAVTLADDPHVRSRGLLGVSSEGVPWLRSPLRFEAAPPVIGQAPGYGQHTRVVLREAGYTEAEIDALVASQAAQG